MPIVKGLADRPDLIQSETKWVRMDATRVDPSPHDVSLEYILTINVSGIHYEFIASEGFQPYQVSAEKALTRITEFERIMRSENHDYLLDRFSAVLKQLDNLGD